MASVNRRHDAQALSSAAQEYLLALRVMAGDGSHVRAAQVARRLGVSTQAASEMFRRLVADGLVRQADGRDLVLTTAGRAAGDTIFRRHALLEWLLTSVIGLGWAESDEEAARLQGALSPRVEARLDEMLGHPPTCPHGNPIDAETARQRPRGTPLSQIEGGQRATIYRITEEAEEDAGLLSYLEARALTPGAAVTVLARSESLDSLTLEGPRGRATLGLRPAALVHVLPGDADPGLFHQVPAALTRRPARQRTAAATLSRPCPTPRSASGSRPARPGPLHIGTARTALFNFLFARHVGGTFLFRLEDTDVARSTGDVRARHPRRASTGSGSPGTRVRTRPAAATSGRSRRTARCSACDTYTEASDRLLAADLAYPCYCTPEELDADRKAQEAAKQPPRYVGRCAAPDRRGARGPARRGPAAAPSASASGRASSAGTT